MSLERVPLALLVLLAAAIVVPALPLLVFQSVGVSTADAPSHLRWLHEFYRGLAHGSPVPGWSDQTFAGFGAYPLMVYGKVSYYLLSPMVWLTDDAWSALRFGIPLTFLLSAWLAYRTGRLFFNRPSSVLVGALYALGPYCVFVPYSQFGITEHGAMIVLPWSVTRIVLLLRRPTGTNLALFGVAYGLVVLAHLLVAFVLGGTLLAVALAAPGVLSRVRSVLWTLGGVAMGLALTAFYWPFTALGGEASQAAKDWYAGQYFRPGFAHFAFGRDNWLIPDTAMPVCYLLAALVCIAVLLAPRFRNHFPSQDRRLWWVLSALVVLTILLESPLSKPVWDRVSLLQQIQRPYRFHAALQLPCCLLLAASWGAIRACRSTHCLHRGSALLGGSAVVMSLSLGAVIPWYLYLSGQKTIDSCRPFVARGTDWPYLAPPTANLERTMKEQANTDWLLRGPGVSSVEVVCWQPEDRTAVFETTGGVVDLRAFHYPGWRVMLDDEPAIARAGQPYGQVQFDAPPGRHQVRLMFGWPARCLIGARISLLATLVCVVLAMRDVAVIRYSRARSSRTPDPSHPGLPLPAGFR